MITETVFGLGGYDPAKSGGNITGTVEDHGDGTATVTVYDPDGKVASAETIDVPLPPEAVETTDDKVDALAAQLAESDARNAKLVAALKAADPKLATAIDAAKLDEVAR